MNLIQDNSCPVFKINRYEEHFHLLHYLSGSEGILFVLFGYLATQENSSEPSQVQTETSHHLSTDDEIISYYMEDFGLTYEEAEELLFQGTMTN